LPAGENYHTRSGYRPLFTCIPPTPYIERKGKGPSPVKPLRIVGLGGSIRAIIYSCWSGEISSTILNPLPEVGVGSSGGPTILCPTILWRSVDNMVVIVPDEPPYYSMGPPLLFYGAPTFLWAPPPTPYPTLKLIGIG
jgi:hypothetical protein